MPREIEIVKETVVEIGSTHMNDYGDMIVTTGTGDEIKIKKTRSYLFPIFEGNPGRAVRIGWGNYMGYDFAAKAELFDGKPPEGQQVEPIKAGVGKALAPAPQAVGGEAKRQLSIERQVSIKLACDISSDTESLEQICEKADKIYKWISNA